MAEDGKRCFVVAPIGDADSETRKRSDQVLRHVIRPAVGQCGYNAVRADEISAPGMITSQVIQHVVNDPLVVADLTDRNPNVFYELAIRHALSKPLVQIIQHDETLPFDVAETRTIFVDHKDLDSVEEAKTEMVKQIRHLETDSSDIETPISVSLDLQRLRQSPNPGERSLADLVAAVVELRQGLGQVESRIKSTEALGQHQVDRLLMRLERRPAGRWTPGFNLSRHDFPMLLETLHVSPQKDPGFQFLIIASFFRASVPWLYEMGVEVYRMARRRPSTGVRKAANEFKTAFDFVVHGPLSSRVFEDRRDRSIVLEELEPFVNRAIRSLRT